MYPTLTTVSGDGGLTTISPSGVTLAGSANITFSDNSIQTTAAVSPTNGFNLNENAVINATSAGNTINIGDQSTQVGTAFNLYNSTFTSSGSTFTSSGNLNQISNSAYLLDNLAITGNIAVISGLSINTCSISFNDSVNVTTTNGIIISGTSYGNSYVSAFNGIDGIGFLFQTNGIFTFGGYNDGTNDYGLVSTALIKSNVGFQFGDGSIQTTAAISGDRYKTTSTSSNTINNSNGKSFICDTGLSYTPLQSCVIYEPSDPQGLHLHCSVVSYDTSTGELIVDITSHAGNGTHTNWVINK